MPYTVGMSFIIRQEREEDRERVERITREAFYNLYMPGCVEHYLVHIMRDHQDFIPSLAYVCELDGEVIGSIMYTKAWLSDDSGHEKEIVTFGPVSVAPGHQRRGYGSQLIAHSLSRASELGYGAAVIFGSPSNYIGLGFVSSRRFSVSLPDGRYPAAMLAKELRDGVFDGRHWIYRGSPVMDISTDDAMRYDDTLERLDRGYRPSQEEFYIMSHSYIE